MADGRPRRSRRVDCLRGRISQRHSFGDGQAGMGTRSTAVAGSEKAQMSGQAPIRNRRRSTPTGFSRIVQFLDHLGVHYNKAPGWGRRGGRAGFWQRNHGELEWILKDAKKAYAAAAIKLHPDKKGGSHEAMAALNAGWDLLKRQFEFRCRRQ